MAREIKEGLKFVIKSPTLRAIMLGDAVFNLFLILYQTMLLVFLEREIGLQSFGIGLILSGMGCGALLGALLATRVSEWVGQGTVIWLASLVTCPLTVLMPLANGLERVCGCDRARDSFNGGSRPRGDSVKHLAGPDTIGFWVG
jgi:Na+/melibiose symporter-like transporter